MPDLRVYCQEAVKHFSLFILFALWEYFLGKAKGIAANSTVEILICLCKHFLTRKGTKMEKQVPIGTIGSITVKESQGVASLVVSIDQSIGGGQAAGVLSAKASVEVDLGARQAADLALALLKAHFPSLSALVDGAQAAIDAELAKV